MGSIIGVLLDHYCGLKPTLALCNGHPRRGSALTVAVNPADNSMPSRLMALKPVKVKVTV
jgi:hypothetical protein